MGIEEQILWLTKLIITNRDEQGVTCDEQGATCDASERLDIKKEMRTVVSIRSSLFRLQMMESLINQKDNDE